MVYVHCIFVMKRPRKAEKALQGLIGFSFPPNRLPLTANRVSSKWPYRILPNMHAPARTPKSPEGHLYSGVIIFKSNDVGRLRGFPNLQFRF